MLGFIKKEKTSILLAVVVCALTLLCCVARYFPTNVGQVYDIKDSPIDTLEKQDVLSNYNCELDDQNKYKILGSDPQLLFSSSVNGIKAAKLNISSAAEKTVPFEIYVALEGEGFTAEKCYSGCIFVGETGAVVNIPNGDYRSIRIDIDSDDGVIFKTLDIYDQKPVTIPYVPEASTKGYVLTVIIPLLCAAIAFFANRHLRWCENAAKAIKQNTKKIALFFALSLAAIPAAAFIEWVLCNVERQGTFSTYRWLFFLGAIELIIAFVLLRKQLAEKPEKLFLAIVLITGFVMLFGTPIKHICWDLDSHYPWAVHTSYSEMAYLTGADVAIDRVAPQSLIGNAFSLESYKNDLAYINSLDGMLIKQVEAEFSIAHLPSGIIIAIARMFGASFTIRYALGRVTYLLVYAFVCYFAIKKIKSGKMILAVICMLPTGLFLATNYAYDCYVTAFTILGTSYFVSELQQPDKPITLKETVIMSVAFVIGAWSKLVYIVLMGMTLFMRKNWKDKSARRRYYLVIISIFVLMFCYFAITTLLKTGEGGDTRGGNVNPIAQIKFILFTPFEYAKILIKFLRQYISIQGMKHYISNFAYLGYGNWWPAFVMLLGFTAVTDASDKVEFKIPTWIKVLSVILFVGMAALIATALFINFTPVNSQTILGCQPRYIIPLLAPLLLLVTGRRKDIIKEKGAYNGFVLLAATSAAMMDVYTAIITKMV